MKRVHLRSSQGTYPILIGHGLLGQVGPLVKKVVLKGTAPAQRKAMIVSNRRVARLYAERVRRSLERSGFSVSQHLMPHGNERDKSQRTLGGLWKAMARVPLERTSIIIALGGGVVGDVAAFAASTYMRGILLVQVPTTLLAQVDSAIGGKTAIDLAAAKNIVGTFYQPKLVISDVDVLGTLDGRTLRHSFAEVIKYGMIRDHKLFALLERRSDAFFRDIDRRKLRRQDLSFLERVVWRSATIKASVVERDERETKGLRMMLNYGHTFAHALEAVSRYRLSHGQAVAMGMVLAGRMARQKGIFTRRAEQRQRNLIERVGLAATFKKKRFSSQQLLFCMKRDKKVCHGRMRFVLPRAIGRVEVFDGISEKRVKKVLDGK